MSNATATSSIEQQLQSQWNDILGRITSKQFFQSDWDIAAFAVFFTFIGLILVLVALVLIRCFCCCCCDCDSQVNRRKYTKKVGVDNLAMEP
ncbi:small integral membrane protein 22 [Rana temporaria]|uniref:small integral membrane protein 22 n=1 Tax=Rana temporaria TaxID=8407 RepID=UPI001AACEB87|nr:small integral membrane protein 22 [Rana temporaria]XP_040212264.1 small integral membrane protein 22 [Rana temporaria]